MQPGSSQQPGPFQQPGSSQQPGPHLPQGGHPQQMQTPPGSPTQESVWRGPASYWVAHPLGYATFGATLGLVLGVAMFVVSLAGGDGDALGTLMTALGVPGLMAVAVAVLWIPTMIVSRLLGRTFRGLGESGGKLLGLLAILLGGGIGYLAAWAAGTTPMWGLFLGFFGTFLSMNIGQAIGRGVYFRRPDRVRVGAIVLGAVVVLAVVAWVVSSTI